MSLPSSISDNAFEQLLQALPADYAELAVEYKAFRRARKIQDATQLLQAVLCYSGLDQSLRTTAGTLALQSAPLSDMAVHKRLKAALAWVQALLRRCLDAAGAGLVPGHLRFVVADGSTVQGPGASETWYRLHLAADLVTLGLIDVKVTDTHEGEALGQVGLQEGDVGVADRGYNRPDDLIAQASRGVSLVARYNAQGMRLYQPDGTKFEPLAALPADALTPSVCYPVQVRSQGQSIDAWVHAWRLPPAQAEKARRRIRAQARKKGCQPNQRTLRLAEWVWVLTTLAPTLLPSATIAALYRIRWQVELVIKRWKSLLDLDHLRARQGGALAQLYLHGKLLYAWLLEQRARRRCGAHWNRLDQPRTATPWRVWVLLRQELDRIISGVAQWDAARWPACLAVMQERPRRRQLQTLPARIRDLIEFCKLNGLSNIDPVNA